MGVYRLLRWILRFVVSVFFRQVEVVGGEHVPPEGGGPLIFAGNHPNSLLDPVLILVTCGRIVHFAAKDVLFKGRLLRPILRHLGAVPVARKSDHGDGPQDNRASFDRLAEVLGEGRAMGIFPEGLSHDDSQLSRLKTGAARIALDVAARRGVPVKIIPCGLNYIRRKRFRSRVLVQYGPPIVIGKELCATFAGDEHEAVHQLTAEVDRAMRALTVNAPDWPTLRVLDAVRRLYQPPGISLADRVELARRFNDVFPKVREQPEVAAIYTRVEEYLERLHVLGLSDGDLRRQMGAGETLSRIARQVALGCVWLPLAAPGIVLHAPLGLFIGWAGLRLTPRKDVIATTKLVLGLLLLPLLFAASLAGVWWRLGPLYAVAAVALLVLSGFATLRVLERGARLGRILAASVRAFALGDEVAALRIERAALEELVVRAVEKFKPADMVALFPRPPT